MSALSGIRSTIFLVTLAVAPLAHAADVPEIRSAIFVAVDLSETWHHKGNEARNEVLLRTVNQGVSALAGRIARPIFVAYAGIGDQSLQQTFMCRAMYHPTLLSGKRDALLKSARELGTFLGSCAKGALMRPSAPLTDLSGSLNFLGRQLGDGPKPIDRYAIILSDMKEDRGSRGEAALNLKGFKVLVIYRALPEDDRDPRGLEARLEKWRKRLADAGAATTNMVIDTGVVAQAIANLANGND